KPVRVLLPFGSLLLSTGERFLRHLATSRVARAVQLYRGFDLSSAPQPAPSPKPAARKPPVRRAAANFAPYSSCTAPRCAAAILQSYLFRRSRASSAWVWTCPRPYGTHQRRSDPKPRLPSPCG